MMNYNYWVLPTKWCNMSHLKCPQCRHFGNSIPEFGEMNYSLLGFERRPFAALIMSRPCFASFPVGAHKFSSYYLNKIIFRDNSLGLLVRESTCMKYVVLCASSTCVLYRTGAVYRLRMSKLYFHPPNAFTV
jgi:hypothetical protein